MVSLLQHAVDIEKATDECNLSYSATRRELMTLVFDFDEADYTITVQIDTETEDVERAIPKYLRIFSERNTDITSGNLALREAIQGCIEHRKKRIMENHQAMDALIQKISLPLKRRGEPADYQVPLHI